MYNMVNFTQFFKAQNALNPAANNYWVNDFDNFVQERIKDNRDCVYPAMIAFEGFIVSNYERILKMYESSSADALKAKKFHIHVGDVLATRDTSRFQKLFDLSQTQS